MSERLVQAIRDVLLKEGETGKGRLADVIGRQTRMIERYVDKVASPSQGNAYKLAVACGLGEEDALAIAKECASVASQRTA